MKRFMAFILLFGGCEFLSETQEPNTMPQLVYHAPLPTLPARWSQAQQKLEVLFHIGKSGEVMEARFLSPTSDSTWESQALEVIRQWQFSPAKVGDSSVAMWIRVPLRIIYTDVKVLVLAEVVCKDRASADSAYRLLTAGANFDTVVQMLSTAPSRTRHGILGDTDIRAYSERIQDELIKLRDEEFTRPIQMGDSFVIFKRVGKKRSPEVI
jgi:TonB family protein